MTNRPKFTKKEVKIIYSRTENPYGIGHCWHCGKKLVFKNRTYGKKGAWHIDHYPVVYRDIENQCCLGVTDPKELTNLVPSCVSCNITHKNEKSYKIWCGRSQCRCEYMCVFWKITNFLFLIAALLLISLTIINIMKYIDEN